MKEGRTGAEERRTRAEGRTTSLARGTILGLVGQAWQLVTAFLLRRYLATVLGVGEVGQWLVTLSVLNYVEMFVTGGFAQIAAKRLAERPNEAPRIERGAYLGQMTFGVVLFVLLEATAGLIASAMNAPYLTPLIRIAALDVPLIAAFMVAAQLHLGKQHFTRQVVGMIAYATAKFLAIGALVYLGFSVPGALVGNALSSIVGFAFLVAPWQRWSGRVREVVDEARGMGIAAIPFLVLNLVAGISYDADLWFVEAIRGSVSAGLYGAAAALTEIVTFLFAALSRTIFPSIARAGAEGDEALVARYARQGIRLALLVTMLGVAVIAATGREALTLVYYKAAYAAAAVPFTILMIASVGRNVRATSADIMLARGQRREALSIVFGLTIAEVVLLVVVTPAFGLVGAAVSAAVSALVAGAVACWRLRGLLGRRVVWTLGRSAAAAAVVGCGLALLHPDVVWLIPSYLAACAVYVGVLMLLREIDADDVASIRAALTSRR